MSQAGGPSSEMASILITGCSSGIGLDAARGLKARGWRVLATCRKAGDAERLRAEGLESWALDHSDEESVANGAREALERTGGALDAAFLNGAFAVPGAAEDVPRGAMRSIFEANLFGVHDLAARLVPAMRARGAGRLVFCSSVLGVQAMPWRGAYNATKFAMEGLVDTMRLELRGSGVHAILIQPGPIATRIRENSIPHFERWIDWRGSALRERYEAQLLARLYGHRGPDRFQLQPAAVTAKLVRALGDARPAPRYRVTAPTYAAEWMRRLLTSRMRDRLMSR